MSTHKIPLQFYRNTNGTEPFRDWLKEMAVADRAEIGGDLMRAQKTQKTPDADLVIVRKRHKALTNQQ